MTASIKGLWRRRRSGRRSARARWLRWLSVSAVVLLAVGAILPALIPRQWLASAVAGAVSRQLGRPAKVASVRVGWGEGVVVEGVEVERREQFGRGLLLRIGRLRCPMAPWRWVVGELGSLQVSRPEVWVVLDTQGRLNVADLPAPGDSMRADSWMVVAGVLHLVDQQRQRQTDVHLGTLRCDLDPRTGRVSWQVNGQLVEHLASGPVEPAAGRLLSEGGLTAPRLNRKARLGGAGSFEWVGLDLGTLPVHWASGLGLDRLAGRSNGRINLELQPDLSLTWRLTVDARDVRAWQSGAAEPQQVESLSLKTNGTVNPNAEALRIEQFHCRIPGLEVSGSGPAVVIAPRSRRPAEVNLSGEVSDLSRIAALVPEFARSGGSSELGGACHFEVRWARVEDTDRFSALIRSERLRLGYQGAVNCAEGCPAEVSMAMRHTPSARWVAVDQLRIRFGAVEASASGELPLPRPESDIEPWLRRFARDATLSAEISTSDMAQAATVWPGLVRALGAAQLSGHAVLRASLSRGGGAVARCEWLLDADSTCRLGDVLDKRPGSAMRFTAWADLAGLPERGLDAFSAQIEYGNGRATFKSIEGLRYAMQPAGPEALQTDVSVRAHLEVAHLEQLLACLPAARRWLTQQGSGAELTGGFSAVIGSNLRGILLEDRAEPQICRVRARVAADAAGVWLDQPVSLRKPAGRPMLLDVDYLYDQTSPGFVHQYGLRWQTEGMDGQLGVGLGSHEEGSQLRVHVADVAAAAAHVPLLADYCARCGLAGGFDASGTWRQDSSGQRLWLELDASSLGGHVPGESGLRKPLGVPARLSLRLAGDPWSGGEPQRWRVDELTMRLAGCRARVESGEIVTDLAVETGGAVEPARPSRWTGPVRSAQLAGTIQVNFGQELRRFDPDLALWLDRYGLGGRTEASGELSVTAAGVSASGDLDATDVQVDAQPYLTKAPGKALRGGFRITGGPPAAASAEGVSVDRAWIEADGNRIEGSGRISLGRDRLSGRIAVKQADATVTVDAPHLERAAAMSGVLTDAELRGGVNGQIAFTVNDGNICLGKSHLVLGGLALRLAKMPFELSSERVEFSHDRVATDGLTVSAGSSSLVLAGDVAVVGDAPRGEWMAAAEWLDADELAGFVSDLSKQPYWKDADPDEAAARARKMKAWLRQGELWGQVHVRQGRLTDAKSGALLLFDELTSNVGLNGGRLRAPFICALSSGAVTGELTSDLREEDPYYDFRYAASGVQPREELTPLIESFFPGMKVRGSIAIEEHTHARWSGAQPGDYPTGAGSMTIEGGTIAGRAAPAAVARIFPGLNLVEFDFRRMRNWFDKLADGRTHNRMIFIGNVYNIYVDGYTFPDDRIDYQVGIDLLARWENQYWAERAQGRIALFYKTGIAEPGGTLKDERVRYLAPHEIMARILRDNLVTTAYYALIKQLRRGD